MSLFDPFTATRVGHRGLFRSERTVHFRSFFERNVHFRSVEMNVLFSTFIFSLKKECSVHFLNVPLDFRVFLAFFGVKSGFISRQKLENRTKRSKNERNVHLRSFPFIFINIIFFGGFHKSPKTRK